MIVLDTTVLVYSVGGDHPLREPCLALVDQIADGLLEATTSVEVVQEFVHVRARRHGRVEAANTGRRFVDLLSPLVAASAEDLDRGLRLFESSHGLGAFDCVLAAVAERIGARALVSADRAFSEGTTAHVVPDAAGVASLLDG